MKGNITTVLKICSHLLTGTHEHKLQKKIKTLKLNSK